MDLGTRNYIENVLQTPVKSTSAEDNWKKLRTGMFVVRAMAREAAAVEDFLSAYNTRHNPKEVHLQNSGGLSSAHATPDIPPKRYSSAPVFRLLSLKAVFSESGEFR